MKNKKLPTPVILTTIALVTAGIGLLEWRALYALDNPPMHKVACLSCHSDVKTMKAMANKSGDYLYLVHRAEVMARANNAEAK